MLALVLVEIIGMLSLTLNLKGILVTPFSFSLGLFILLSPPLYMIVGSWTDRIDFRRGYILLLLIIPIFFFSFFLVISNSDPVGLDDTHIHILESYQVVVNGGTSFVENSQISVTLAGLYIFNAEIALLLGMDVWTIALFIPQIILLFYIVILYCILMRVQSFKVAMLSIFILCFESNVILFGQEVRTQDMAMIFIAMILLIIVIKVVGTSASQISLNFIWILSLIMIPLISFTSLIFCLIMFLGIAIFTLYSRKHEPINFIPGYIIRGSILALLIFASYLLYVSGSFETFIRLMSNLIEGTVGDITGSGSPNIGGSIYGPIIMVLMYSSYLIFAFAFIYTWYKINIEARIVMIGFGSMMAIGVVGIIGGPLNPGRAYEAAFISASLSMTFVALTLLKHKVKFVMRLASVCLILFIALFIIIQPFKLPNYIIGDSEPIRGVENIDSVYYYSRDDQQRVASDMAFKSYSGEITLNATISHYYYLISSWDEKSRSSGSQVDNLQSYEIKEISSSSTYSPHIQSDLATFVETQRIYDNGAYVVLIKS